MKRITGFMCLLALLTTSMVLMVGAQDISPFADADDPAVQITFPLPVYALAGEVEIMGSADAIDMSNYFIEYRELMIGEDGSFIDNPTADDTDVELPWSPAAFPVVGAVQDGILGIWDTTRVEDGLYEIRLTVNITDSVPQFFRVSPLRVDNSNMQMMEITPTPIPDTGIVRATLPPSPTAPGDTGTIATQSPNATPIPSGDNVVTAVVDANVRAGDNTQYARIGSLLAGESAPVIGISNSGSGWLYIQLDGGREGFIAPSIVSFTGDRNSLPRVAPPPPPEPSPTLLPSNTPTPPSTATPTITPTVASSANLRIVSVVLSPNPPACGTGFNVLITIENNGSTSTNSSGGISVSDKHVSSGTSTGSTTGGFPILAPGQTFEAFTALTVNTFVGEEHDILVTIDSGNQVAETNEGDNSSGVRYVLGAGC
ncbi:MAG: SH3 domain-containing protein [Aggregatilineales bacterium]